MTAKLISLAVCALAAATVLPAQIVAPRDSVISVTATRTTRVAPDRVSFFIVVEGTAETAPDAVARAQTKIQAVTAAVRQVGGVEMDRPIAYSVGSAAPPVGYPTSGLPASQLSRWVIHVQTNHPDEIAKVISSALAAGASTATGLTFESTTADSVRRSRVAEAIASARGDAEAIARSVGGRLGDLIEVTTSGSPQMFVGPTQFSLDNRFGMPTTAPEVAINTTVTARYRLVK